MSPQSTTVSGPTSIHITLWIVQLVLAAAFGMAGVMKSTLPMADLTSAMGWPGDLPPTLVRFIGASELAGALGLVLPSATRFDLFLHRCRPSAWSS